METTIEFLNAVMEKHDIKSDNQLALFLGCTRASVSAYRYKKSFMDDSIALKVSETLGIDSGYILACVHAERARKPEEKKAWFDIAQRMAIAAAVLIVIALPFQFDAGHPATLAALTIGNTSPLYIM